MTFTAEGCSRGRVGRWGKLVLPVSLLAQMTSFMTHGISPLSSICTNDPGENASRMSSNWRYLLYQFLDEFSFFLLLAVGIGLKDPVYGCVSIEIVNCQEWSVNFSWQALGYTHLAPISSRGCI